MLPIKTKIILLEFTPATAQIVQFLLKNLILEQSWTPSLSPEGISNLKSYLILAYADY